MVDSNETLTERADRLARELQQTRQQIAACPHQFGDPLPVLREYKEPEFSHYKEHGSDPEPVYNWVPRTKTVYERTCDLCGYIQETEKTKPVITGHEPDFGGLR